MPVIADPLRELETLSDLLERMGGVPPSRVLMNPAPGTATEQDVETVHSRTGRLCELVDGTLVEKGMGLRESILATAIAAALRAFIIPRNLGVVSGESGMMRLFTGLVRIPDVAYVSWDRMPAGRIPTEPVPDLAPNLAVEVLSKTNTPKEMDRKRREYFAAGVQMVWTVDPDLRVVHVHASPDEFRTLSASDPLDGGSVLPGFVLPLKELFAELDRVGES